MANTIITPTWVSKDVAVAWKRIRDLHLGWWVTIAVGSVGLHAFGG